MRQEVVYWFADRCNPKGGGATDGHFHKCDRVPSVAICDSCHGLRPDWHPKPPPTVRLYLKYEGMDIDSVGVMVLHEALFDILRHEWPDALTTRCSSHPESPLKIGERYLAVCPPPRASIVVYNEGGEFWQCKECGRWVFGGGPWINRYTVLSDDQQSLNAFSDSRSIFVRPSIRERIAAIEFDKSYWQKVTVRKEIKPHHRRLGGNYPPTPREP